MRVSLCGKRTGPGCAEEGRKGCTRVLPEKGLFFISFHALHPQHQPFVKVTTFGITQWGKQCLHGGGAAGPAVSCKTSPVFFLHPNERPYEVRTGGTTQFLEPASRRQLGPQFGTVHFPRIRLVATVYAGDIANPSDVLMGLVSSLVPPSSVGSGPHLTHCRRRNTPPQALSVSPKMMESDYASRTH